MQHSRQHLPIQAAPNVGGPSLGARSLQFTKVGASWFRFGCLAAVHIALAVAARSA